MSQEESEENTNKYYEKEFQRIFDYFCWEEERDILISKKTTLRRHQFVLFEKDWIKRWKILRDYNKIKLKLSLYKSSNQENQSIIKQEIINQFREKDNNNPKNILLSIGLMNIQKIIRGTGYNVEFEENSNFEPISDNYFYRFIDYFMDRKILNAEGIFANGKLILYNSINKCTINPLDKIVIFYKINDNNDLSDKIAKIVIENKYGEDIKILINKFKEITIEKFMNEINNNNSIFGYNYYIK